jgi:hypothetical protein
LAEDFVLEEKIPFGGKRSDDLGFADLKNGFFGSLPVRRDALSFFMIGRLLKSGTEPRGGGELEAKKVHLSRQRDCLLSGLYDPRTIPFPWRV